MDNILEVSHVTKEYRERKRERIVLEDISFSLVKGEMLGIAGSSGCGKSTLLHVAAGMEVPDRGKISYTEEIRKYQKGDRKTGLYRYVQMVFQEPAEAFSPRMTIKEFLMDPLLNFHIADKNKAETMVKDILEEVGLSPDFLGRLPHRLSGGQLQRVVIARVLLLNPQLILFDEPTSALDVVTQAKILNLITDSRRKHPFSGIFVSHDLAAVQSMTDRVLIMNYGKIVERIASTDLKNGLHPATRKLIASQLKKDNSFISSDFAEEIFCYDGEEFFLEKDIEKIEEIKTGKKEMEFTIDKQHSVRAFRTNKKIIL